MKLSTYQTINRQKERDKAILLYKQGLTTREVAKMVGKSHAWVALRVKEGDVDKSVDKVLQKSIIKL